MVSFVDGQDVRVNDAVRVDLHWVMYIFCIYKPWTALYCYLHNCANLCIILVIIVRCVQWPLMWFSIEKISFIIFIFITLMVLCLQPSGFGNCLIVSAGLMALREVFLYTWYIYSIYTPIWFITGWGKVPSELFLFFVKFLLL